MKFGIIGNIQKSSIREITEDLLGYLTLKKIPFIVHDELGQWFNNSGAGITIDQEIMVNENQISQSCDILIALGGDGTMLAAARIIGNKGTPILGVNLGKLGFLAEISIDELQDCIDDIAAGEYYVDERIAIEATAINDGKKFTALNDIVIDRGSSSRIIDLETYVDNDYLVTYAADGLIISTPTGSTAYSLASGGPIVTPGSNVLVISPISPHTLSARPVVVQATSIIKVLIHPGHRGVHITADGQTEAFYDTPIEFTIRKTQHVVKLVKRKKWTYFDLLRTKLMWGKDIRRDK
ncbi:MAG: NAD(+)/NADH kinase [Bacteroidota bacterium]|nr:NAD(+)/NADH kinase [Bacteroidota bacterium]